MIYGNQATRTHYRNSLFVLLLYSATMIKFKSPEFLGLRHTIPGNIKNAVYSLEISALVPEILKFEKMCKICKLEDL